MDRTWPGLGSLELQLTACLSCCSSAESAVSFDGQSYMRFLHGMDEDEQDFKLSLRFRTSREDGVIASTNSTQDWGVLLVCQSPEPSGTFALARLDSAQFALCSHWLGYLETVGRVNTVKRKNIITNIVFSCISLNSVFLSGCSLCREVCN